MPFSIKRPMAGRVTSIRIRQIHLASPACPGPVPSAPAAPVLCKITLKTNKNYFAAIIFHCRCVAALDGSILFPTPRGAATRIESETNRVLNPHCGNKSGPRLAPVLHYIIVSYHVVPAGGIMAMAKTALVPKPAYNFQTALILSANKAAPACPRWRRRPRASALQNGWPALAGSVPATVK